MCAHGYDDDDDVHGPVTQSDKSDVYISLWSSRMYYRYVSVNTLTVVTDVIISITLLNIRNNEYIVM